tara:strand:+ start:212 stop:400 length:189 start_codon:yes stop_codon:yes gene_type:complete
MWLLLSKGNFIDKLRIFLKKLSQDNYDFLTRDDPLPFLVPLIKAVNYLFSKKSRNYYTSRGL